MQVYFSSWLRNSFYPAAIRMLNGSNVDSLTLTQPWYYSTLLTIQTSYSYSTPQALMHICKLYRFYTLLYHIALCIIYCIVCIFVIYVFSYNTLFNCTGNCAYDNKGLELTCHVCYPESVLRLSVWRCAPYKSIELNVHNE